MGEGLAELSRWFRCNRLTLNLKKTEYVYFGGQGGHREAPWALEVGGVQIRRVEGARFLGVWVDEVLGWKGQIGQVRAKVGRLLGVLGRASAVVGGRSLLSLYNGLVLPHLQYCLMVWGDFEGCNNVTLGGSLLRHQKRFAGLVAGVKGRYHADPFLAQHGMLKVGDLYRQQLRIHAWRFWNGRLPEGQAAMLARVGDVHTHATRAARSGLFFSTSDQRSVGYRVPSEWASLTGAQRGAVSLAAFKRGSRGFFLSSYGAYVCRDGGCGGWGGQGWA